MTRLRAAVVGVGNMGRHHARILGSMADVDLVAVVDPDEERAARRAQPAGAIACSAVSELPDVDFAVVATPTATHMETACELMARGTHLLVEKPLASTVEEAQAIADAALAADVILAVGHVERFNAALRALGTLTESPLALSFERLSPYTPRIRDSVVFDLMVHDLDLACWITRSYPTRIEATGLSVFSESLDVAHAILEFPGGSIASLQASRITQDKVRRVSISEAQRYLVADSIREDLSIKRETSVDFYDAPSATYRQASVIEVPYLDRGGEPLARELRNVVDAVRAGSQPLVDAAAGVSAVQLATDIETAAERR